MLEIIGVISHKTTYLVSVRNQNGDIKREWIDGDFIKLIDPHYVIPDYGNNNPEIEPGSVFECDKCNAKIKRRDHFLEHVRRHLVDTKKMPCLLPNCDSEFGYKSNLKQHMKRIHKWSDKKFEEHWAPLQQYEQMTLRNTKKKSKDLGK